MKASALQVLRDRIEHAEEAGTLRTLKSRHGVDFCSNDYLGFSSDPRLKKRILERLVDFPNGSTGSRLIRGQLDLFEDTERKLAEFSDREAALLFASGYQANVGLLSALLRPGDIVFSDEKNHASIIDGIRLGRADVRIYPHADILALRKLLEAERHRVGLKVIVTESLFSMDGDQAPLIEMAALVEEFSAQLIVDEAHATGLWGSGLVEMQGLMSQVLATVHTGGKALGCAGAWIACDGVLKRYLINFCRPFIFSTAPMPALASTLSEATQYWKEVGHERSTAVLSKSGLFRKLLFPQDSLSHSFGPVVPFILGSNERALKFSHALKEEGFDIRAIRPPTISEGSSRLRITIRAQTDIADLERLAQTLRTLLETHK